MTSVLSGGCLCGHIRFSAVNPRQPHSCSCDLCQKHTGAQSVIWLEFAASDVRWNGEGGQPATWRSSAGSSRAFCPRCGSSLGAIDDGPTVALLTGVVDNNDNEGFSPEYHAFEDMKPAWWRRHFPSC